MKQLDSFSLQRIASFSSYYSLLSFSYFHSFQKRNAEQEARFACYSTELLEEEEMNLAYSEQIFPCQDLFTSKVIFSPKIESLHDLLQS
jgi:hypothetical protein